MKLVKFEDGTYGVRHDNECQFLDLSGDRVWWNTSCNVEKYCKASESDARMAMSQEDARNVMAKKIADNKIMYEVVE